MKAGIGARCVTAFVASALTALPPVSLHAQASLSAGELQVGLSTRGSITALRNKTSGKDYLSREVPAPLLTLVSEGTRIVPTSLAYSGKLLTLQYAPAGVRVTVRVRETPTYLALEVASASPANKVDAVIWGPYPTIIAKTVGEIIGVVRDGQVALGMQVLNMKTLGGDMPNSEGSTWARGIAARAFPWGSALQAYSINRDRGRLVDAWGGNHRNMPVPALHGETVVGSSIALFSCPEPATLDMLERIEVAEHLPHPTIDGVWFRKSPLFERSYMISSFGEADVDEMIGYAKRAGLFSLYHEGPFKSWGHFVLREDQFPNGRAGMKAAVDKAHAAGLHFGVHTLTNFLNTNDPYVTPVPDYRLSVTGSSTLVKDIDATAEEIEVKSAEFFAEQKENYLHTVKIGKELIRYKSVTAAAPYTLLDCQRGAFGTTASAHRAGDVAGKLFDHSYNVFFPNFAMQREVATNLAVFLNETGADHIDFDGHEGALASGEGDYALAVFAKDVLDQTKHDLINGTSTSKTYYWHIGSYYNWGEPWNGGFTESMQQYRIDNQGLFERNYMPHMLGWYLLTESTTLAEMEWMLARAAGYGAGFAMVARPNALRRNPLAPALLDAIREWELARTNRVFDSAQVARLKDPKNEFHLEKTGEGRWNLRQFVLSPSFTREHVERQPGEPTSTAWEYQQSWDAQRLQFRMEAVGKGGSARNFSIKVDQYATLELPVELAAGESVVCDGTETIQVYDKLGQPKARLRLAALPPTVEHGPHKITMDSAFSGDEPPRIELQFRGLGRVQAVRVN
jgi:hypothetical protein